MRIRKRTPARAASPGPTRYRSESPPAPQQLKQEGPHEKEEAEEEKARLSVGVGEEEDLVPATSKSRAMCVQKQDPEPGTKGASTAALLVRCSRNDGKRWRCKSEAVLGYLFCDRHIAWSTRRRKPRASKKNRSGSVLEEERAKEEDNEEYETMNKYNEATEASNLPCDGGSDEFNYYGGFQPGSRKRARNGGAGPAA